MSDPFIFDIGIVDSEQQRRVSSLHGSGEGLVEEKITLFGTYLHISKIILESVIQALRNTGLVSFIVCPHAYQTVNTSQDKSCDGSNNNAFPPVLIERCILWAKEERAGEIT